MPMILKNEFAVCLHGRGEVAHRIKNNFTTACGIRLDHTWRLIIDRKPDGKFECPSCETAFEDETSKEPK